CRGAGHRGATAVIARRFRPRARARAQGDRAAGGGAEHRAPQVSAADYPRVDVRTAAEWRRWLRDHHARERGAWLVSYRRVTGKPAVEYDDAVREALCYGWVGHGVKPLPPA